MTDYTHAAYGGGNYGTPSLPPSNSPPPVSPVTSSGTAPSAGPLTGTSPITVSRVSETNDIQPIVLGSGEFKDYDIANGVMYRRSVLAGLVMFIGAVVVAGTVVGIVTRTGDTDDDGDKHGLFDKDFNLGQLSGFLFFFVAVICSVGLTIPTKVRRTEMGLELHFRWRVLPIAAEDIKQMKILC
eukprot:GHVQ01040173.1.p1 GENE.GHVQ01040173.1~~GHVQ01040173.1.p1  ORF type:complete len:184 (-),score=28.95 GHVQ01040173.1:211-762(-)